MDDPDLIACADLLRRGDPDRFRAVMAAPVAARAVLFPLHAFNVEVTRAPWVTSEEMIAEMRLQWWRDALDEIATGRPPRQHQVVRPLARLLDAEGAALLDALVAARRRDITGDPFADGSEFDGYIEKTSAHLLWVAARALGADDRARAAVLDLGYAMGLANYLRAVPDLERAGRLPLPDGRPGAVRALANDGLARLASARRARATIPAPARAALLPACDAAALLARAARTPARVADGTLSPAPALSRLRLMRMALTGRW